MHHVWRLFRVLFFQAAFRRSALPVAVIVFLLLTTALARTKAPWCDEGWFANPAYNLAFHGQMGTSVLEPSGHFLNAYLSGIKERTYIVVPNHMVALAAWFRIFGFSLFTMRAYSIVWGGLGLLLFYWIVSKFFPDQRVAQLGTLFTAIDFVYLWSSADGRMDMSVSTLALASVAAYLYFREKNFTRAVLLSQVIGAVAVFTHPNALVVLLAVPVFVWRSDRGQLQPRHFYLAAIPYLFFGILWLLYILQSPTDFAAQFFANAVGRNSSRWKTIIQPWIAVWREIARHLATYSVSGLWSGTANGRMIFVPLLYIGGAICFVANWKSFGKSARMFLAFMLTVILAMTFLNGFKAANYLVYLIPFYCAALAFGLLALSDRSPLGKLIAAAIGIGFVFLQLGDSIQHIQADEYHREYLPAVAQLQEERSAGKSVLGTSALGFGLGFQGFGDDWRLGLYSGLKPDILLLDRSYRDFAQWFETDEPPTFNHLVSTLTVDYRLTRRLGQYWIFERHPEATPWIDVSGMDLKRKGKKAEYLFKELSSEVSDSSNGSTATAALRF
jgi:hypothetical protein